MIILFDFRLTSHSTHDFTLLKTTMRNVLASSNVFSDLHLSEFPVVLEKASRVEITAINPTKKTKSMTKMKTQILVSSRQ